MPRPDEPKSESPFADWATSWWLSVFLVRCLAYPHELFTRRPSTVGRSYPGAAVTFVGLVLLPLLTLAPAPEVPFPTPQDQPLVGLMPYLHWAVMAVLAAARWAPNSKRPPVHSQFIGEPPGGLRRDPWRAGEVLIGLLLGGGFHLVGCHALGALHLLGLACSRGHLTLIGMREGREEQRMRDARIEAAYYADRMRHPH